MLGMPSLSSFSVTLQGLGRAITSQAAMKSIRKQNNLTGNRREYWCNSITKDSRIDSQTSLAELQGISSAFLLVKDHSIDTGSCGDGLALDQDLPLKESQTQSECLYQIEIEGFLKLENNTGEQRWMKTSRMSHPSLSNYMCIHGAGDRTIVNFKFL
ncbi:uncharacterized protein BT62DRAFT_922781 [Guyanagaster necrorhizus]|uniref:Uncharacterized protein n=1 Tax=Guyanagaster necrorhizus TaxID=856835 RepID=A0A9P7VL66_9AGAR|nr:uncharacterized protein BT62DRAFT_922781 [Guyanagaster necrorhizus MCA 3950]KAG7442380.1 hypothetical protein BT62DRAFT_922781 [Guyanagaster necrorhizus MCA 3950]